MERKARQEDVPLAANTLATSCGRVIDLFDPIVRHILKNHAARGFPLPRPSHSNDSAVLLCAALNGLGIASGTFDEFLQSPHRGGRTSEVWLPCESDSPDRLLNLAIGMTRESFERRERNQVVGLELEHFDQVRDGLAATRGEKLGSTV